MPTTADPALNVSNFVIVSFAPELLSPPPRSPNWFISPIPSRFVNASAPFTAAPIAAADNVESSFDPHPVSFDSVMLFGMGKLTEPNLSVKVLDAKSPSPKIDPTLVVSKTPPNTSAVTYLN